MKSRAFRIKKSKSMLVSLYFLSVLSVIIYVFLFCTFLLNLVQETDLKGFSSLFFGLVQSVKVVFVPSLLVIPFCVFITFFAVDRRRSRLSSLVEKSIKLIDEAPLILYGLFFFLIVKNNFFALSIVVALIAALKLSRRWIHLSKKVSLNELETLKALGFDFLSIFRTLYIKRFHKEYLGHFIAVNCFLLTLLKPFLIFSPQYSRHNSLLTLELYKNLLENEGGTSLIILLLIGIYFVKVFCDGQMDYFEVENG